ncbi:serine/threonine-protein kinase [Sinosporangium siamense]|nr:serine/threonine-protein kinase [Sinosporangium siamense]
MPEGHGAKENQGRLVGSRYRLLSPVGRGGMGMVWHAHDVLLDRDVAVKELILPYGLDEAGKRSAHRRMLREARSAARLSHPGIVTVHDVVEEDERPWIVMELVRAWSLEQAVRQSGPLPVVQAAEIGVRILDALRHAHAAGILHRDVKPGNVMLTSDRVILTDFGIAAVEGDVNITQTGLLMGSPAYIPPERLQGQPVTHSADLWSFGATLYAAVEGRPPYEGPDAVAVLGAVLTQEPTRPQRAGALLPVIDGLLRKNPAERINAGQVAEMLERVLRSHGSSPPDLAQTPAAAAPDAAAAPHLLPPLDPPLGPTPLRIIETPSGPIRVPADGSPLMPAIPNGTHPDVPASPAAPPADDPFGSPADLQSLGFDALRSSSGGNRVPDTPAGEVVPEAPTTPRPVGRGRRGTPAPAPRSGRGGRRRAVEENGKWMQQGQPTPRLIAVAAAGVVALVAAIMLIVLPGGEEEPATPQGNVPTAKPPARSTTPRPVTGSGRVPDGYKRRVQGGFSAAIPTSWRTTEREGGFRFNGPQDSRMSITVLPATPVADGGYETLTRERAGATVAEYIQIQLQTVSYGEWKATDWEYTYTESNGVPMHALTRFVNISDDKAYTIEFALPEARWDDNAKLRATFLDTFTPS